MSIKLLKDDVKSGKLSPDQAVAEAQKRLTQGISHGLKTKRKYVPEPHEKQLERLRADKGLRDWAQQHAIPFIDGPTFQDFKLVQGLYLIGAVSGQGKSTAAANIISGYLTADRPGKKVYVISNEEMADAVLGRVACIESKVSYNDYKHKRLSRHTLQEIDDLSELLLQRVHVVNNPTFDMSCLEDVQAVLEYAQESGDVDMVMVDYFQTIDRSKDDEGMESFRVHKIMGSYLKDYGRKYAVPVLAFAQLRPEAEGSHFKVRIENDRTVYNHAFGAVEIIPNFETGQTTFKIWKDRFGEVQGKEIEMRFEKGRYIAQHEDSV